MHLTRRQDLLDLELPPADLTPYEPKPNLMKPNPSLLSSNTWTISNCPSSKHHHAELAQQAAQQHWDHVEYLRRLIEGEYSERRQRVIERRIKAARFPVLKTLEQFRWDWPKKINRLRSRTSSAWSSSAQKANVVFLGNVGLGKTHLATALGYAACLEGHSVLFANAISVINDLSRRPETRAASNASSKTTCARNCWSWTRSAIFPSTSTAPICSSRSSASATNAAPSS